MKWFLMVPLHPRFALNSFLYQKISNLVSIGLGEPFHAFSKLHQYATMD
jgi:hypothetical protein